MPTLQEIQDDIARRNPTANVGQHEQAIAMMQEGLPTRAESAASLTPPEDTYTGSPQQQYDQARAAGNAAAAQGQQVYGQQQGAAQGYQQQGAGYQVTAPSITGASQTYGGGGAPTGGGAPSYGGGGGRQPTPLQQQLNQQVLSGQITSTEASAIARAAAGGAQVAQQYGGAPLAGGAALQRPGQPSFGGQVKNMPAYNAPGLGYSGAMSGGGAAPGGMSGGFQLGTQAQAGPLTGVGGVDPGSLGSVGSVAGGLGAAPGAIAGQLGGAPSIANVGNVSGRLGGAPQVGQVGDIRMGNAPGNIAGLLSTMGQDNGGQASMMGRLEGFLDQAPGASVAEAQLQQSQADNMAALIGAARSGRGGAGAQAQALLNAQSEGGAIMADTAGQLATLRAQEEDMRRNRQLQAIGLGGDLSTAMRGQDIQYRGQDLGALQSDQSTQLGARGQDLTGAMANQQTQTALEQLRGNLGIQARGQDLQGLQGDQTTQAILAQARGQLALGARGQDLSALQGDQAISLGARGQNLGALSADAANQLGMRQQNLGARQGNQQAQLGMRGQDMAQNVGMAGVNANLRGQDLNALTTDAMNQLAAQGLALQGGLGYGALGNQAQGQGLDFLSQQLANQLQGEALAQNAQYVNNQLHQSGMNANTAAQAGIQQQQMAIDAQPGFWEQAGLGFLGGIGQGAGMGLGTKYLSDERAKEDIAPADSEALHEHLKAAPGYSYRYKPGLGEDPETPHVGPMAQGLERSPFASELVDTSGPLKMVRTDRLSLVNHSALAMLAAEVDELRGKLEARG